MLSDIEAVHGSVPGEAQVCYRHRSFGHTLLCLPVCQPWLRCLYFIHSSTKLPDFNVDVGVQITTTVPAFKGKRLCFSHTVMTEKSFGLVLIREA